MLHWRCLNYPTNKASCRCLMFESTQYFTGKVFCLYNIMGCSVTSHAITEAVQCSSITVI